jgi:hypothetical protein
MSNEPKPESQSSQQPHEQIPEVELAVFRKVMKSHFAIACEPTDREYLVRFIGQPYEQSVDSCRSLAVITHNRGTTLSPHNVKQVLAKFEIAEEDFMEAYSLQTKGISPIRPG